MIAESIGFFICLLVLSLVGVGPALWLVTSATNRVGYAIGIAPIVGYCLITIIAFPLARYVAPIHAWAWPVTIVLVLISLAMVYLVWRRDKNSLILEVKWRDSVAVTALILISWLVLVAPLMINGFQYVVFRTNPSDAFNYISLAETLRTVHWSTLLNGMALTASNLHGLGELAVASPTALFSARLVAYPLALNKMAALAWMAEIASVPVYRFFHAHHLISLAMIVPTGLAVADQINISRGLKYLVALALALGFWARFVLETDAGYEISVAPVVLLTVFAWIQLEQEPTRALSRARLLLALACATVVCLYSPLALILTVAFGIYYAIILWQKLVPIRPVFLHAVTVALIIVIFLVSGQLDFVFRSTLSVIMRASGEKQFAPIVLNLIKSEGVAAIWGLPPSLLAAQLPVTIRRMIADIATGTGVILTIALVVTVLFVIQKPAARSRKIVVAMILAGGVVAVLSILADNRRAAGKAFTYVYPYIILAVLIFPAYAEYYFTPLLQKGVLALLAVWLTTQGLISLYLPYRDVVVDSLDSFLNGSSVSRVLKNDKNYDLSAITAYLNEHPPRQLVVAIPRDGAYQFNSEEAWPFAFYSMFVFADYPVYYQSGYIIDNSLSTRNLWFGPLTIPPDYAVVSKTFDYIGPQGLGSAVAQSQNLVLYRLDEDNARLMDILAEHETMFKNVEARKGELPP